MSGLPDSEVFSQNLNNNLAAGNQANLQKSSGSNRWKNQGFPDWLI